MQETSTAILSSTLIDNKNLIQHLTKNKIAIINEYSINTKESIIPVLEDYKPSFLFIPSNIPGVIELTDIVGKIKRSAFCTKIVIVTNQSDLKQVTEYLLCGTDAIIFSDSLNETVGFALQQLIAGQLFLCSKSISQIKYSMQKEVCATKFNSGLLDMLTDREAEVLYSLTQGINYKQIAKLLFISESTVKTHINNIFTKLNVNDRTQAVLYALHHGISSLVKKPNILQNLTNITSSQQL